MAKAKTPARRRPRMISFDRLPHAKQVERWEQAYRVLKELTPHQKRKHFNMREWGLKTPCGTIACAGGFCAMDSWFQARGLFVKWVSETVEFVNPDNEDDTLKVKRLGADEGLSDRVDRFFGEDGAGHIFFNPDQRSVSTVMDEIKDYLSRLRAYTY